jgi:uncharacterized protein
MKGLISHQHASPAYHLIVDGVDITSKVNGRLIRLTLTEALSEEADTLSLSLSDHDGAIVLPHHGAVISLALGWEGERLIDKGTFMVDETEHQGPPDEITIRARSANLRDDLPGKKSRSWTRVTLGELVRELGLTTSDGSCPFILAPPPTPREEPHHTQTQQSRQKPHSGDPNQPTAQ